MAKASDIRDNLWFSNPLQKMYAINLNCCSAYGSMLWDLSSEYCERFFKAWNIQARLAFGVPMMTHTYLIENVLCADVPSLRSQVVSRYPNFSRNLENSPSKEVKFLYRIVKEDPYSVTYKNMNYVNTECGEDVSMYTSGKVRELVPNRSVPENESWRCGLLSTLMNIKISRSYSCYNLSYENTCLMINSLCIN